MKKLSLIVGLSVLGIVGFMSKSEAGLAGGPSIGGSYSMTEVSASSAVVFSSAGWVQGVYWSSGTTNGLDWFVLIDTPTPYANTAFGAFTSDTKRTPARWFASSNTASQDSLDFGDTPVFFDKGCFLYKTSASQGEARKVFIKWKQ